MDFDPGSRVDFAPRVSAKMIAPLDDGDAQTEFGRRPFGNCQSEKARSDDYDIGGAKNVVLGEVINLKITCHH